MIGGEFDLSVGSMIGFAGMVMAILAVQYGVPLWLAILIAFAVAMAYRRPQRPHRRAHGPALLHRHPGRPLHPARPDIGFTRLITGRTQVSGLKPLVEHDPLAWLFSGKVGCLALPGVANAHIIGARNDGLPLVQGLPVSVVWWLVITAICTWILLRTKLGNWIFACGGDPNAARNVGVPVNRVKIGLFMFTAFAATVFACVQTLSVGSADVLRGDLQEFQAIIAAVIGGCLLTGGYGSAIGAAFGALIFGTVQQGIFYTGANTDWFKVFLGVMLLIAVLFNSYIRKKATECTLMARQPRSSMSRTSASSSAR